MEAVSTVCEEKLIKGGKYPVKTKQNGEKIGCLNKINVMFSNVDIFTSDKVNELKARIGDMSVKPHVISMLEVKPKNYRYERSMVEFNITGYELFGKNVSEESCGRGMLMYVKHGVSYSVEEGDDFCEYIKVIIKGEEDILLTAVYRSPNSTIENNNKLLDLLQEIGEQRKMHKIVIGDFNLPNINWTTCTTLSGEQFSESFIEKIRDCFFVQHIKDITRCRGSDQGSVLDLVFTDDDLRVEEIEVNSPLGKSDHACIMFQCDIEPQLRKTKRKVFLYEKGNYSQMKDKLNIDWNNFLNTSDVDEMWNKFTTKMQEVISECIPCRVIKERKSRKNINSDLPMNRKLKAKIKKKQRLWERLKKMAERPTSGDEEYLKVQCEYRRLNNQVRKETRREVKVKEQTIAQNVKSNPKIFWKYINSKTKSVSGITELYKGGDKNKKTTSDKEKAEELGEFFSSVFTDEPQGAVPELQVRPVPPFSTMVINREDIRKTLKKVKRNKSPGPDGLHPRVILEVADVLVEPLWIIFNNSLEKHQVPSEWKLANITAIFKKGDKSDPSNYRPVSLTSILSKVMEKIVRENIMKHMSYNNLFSKKQYGFLPGRSTVLQLIQVLDEWTESIDRGWAVDVAYCDLKKAFDTVPHRRLLEKLRAYNITGELLYWIKSFLCGRKQCVIVNGEKSEMKDVLSGVPQGSVLGPLLFVIYVNDLVEEIKNSSIFLYADDTKLFKEIKCKEDCEALQEDLQRMEGWSRKWLLKFHPQKCCFMRIGRTKEEIFKYRMEEELKEVNSEKDLGVVIDNGLSFDEHLAEKVNKANKIVGIIRRTFLTLDESMFKALYTAMVRPHLEYANQVWCPFKKKDIEIIENVQRRATKQIPTLKNMSYEQRLSKLELPTLAYRRIRGDMIETYKIVNGSYDRDVCEDLLTMSEDIGTRGHNKKLYKRRSRLDKRKYAFGNRVVNIWNSLPADVVNSESVKSFEKKLDNFWKGQSLRYDYKETIKIHQHVQHPDQNGVNLELESQA